MKVFVTGASGWVGRHVTPLLLAHGHTVIGLSRSASSHALLTSMGVTPVTGTLTDLDVLRSAAASSDAIIHLAFIHNFTEPDHDFAANVNIDTAAILAMGQAIKDSNKIFINTSGTIGLPKGPDGVGREDTNRPNGGIRPDHLGQLVEWGLRAIVVRLSPTVHGSGDKGFVRRLISRARANGFSAYVGDGSARWSAVHVEDAAELYVAALEGSKGGINLHGVAEEGVRIKDIAEVIGKRLNLLVKSVEPAQAHQLFDFMGMFMMLDSPTGNVITKQVTGWNPTRPGLVEDLATSETYFH